VWDVGSGPDISQTNSVELVFLRILKGFKGLLGVSRFTGIHACLAILIAFNTVDLSLFNKFLGATDFSRGREDRPIYQE
jgi:hypothetical protein